MRTTALAAQAKAAGAFSRRGSLRPAIGMPDAKTTRTDRRRVVIEADRSTCDPK
jgi:hypothetical protein